MDTQAQTDAQLLLSKWAIPTPDNAGTVMVPFCEAVETLLNADRLDAAINALAGAVPAMEDDDLHNLMQLAHSLSMETAIPAKQTPGHDIPLGQMVAFPMLGTLRSLTIDPAFWTAVNDHLTVAAKAYLGRNDLVFQVCPLDNVTRPESLSMLTVDSLRRLTVELATGQPGPSVALLVEMDQTLDAVSDPYMKKSTAVQQVGQRMALAALVYDPDQWHDGINVLSWLDDLMADDAWMKQFFTADRFVMPAMGVPEAMVEMLAARFRLSVDISLEDREMVPDRTTADLSWSVVDEIEATDGVVSFLPHINGVSLDPIPVTGGWLTMIGPEGVSDACSAWEGEQPITGTQAKPEPDDFVTAPRRHRLH